MSALPPKADMCSATRDVRFGPKADIVSVRRVTKKSAVETSSLPHLAVIWLEVLPLSPTVVRDPPVHAQNV
jgi:hypothetical protein